MPTAPIWNNRFGIVQISGCDYPPTQFCSEHQNLISTKDKQHASRNYLIIFFGFPFNLMWGNCVLLFQIPSDFADGKCKTEAVKMLCRLALTPQSNHLRKTNLFIYFLIILIDCRGYWVFWFSVSWWWIFGQIPLINRLNAPEIAATLVNRKWQILHHILTIWWHGIRVTTSS